jgi:nucleoside diphosphate kinase
MTSFSRLKNEISSYLRILIISIEFEVILKLLQKLRSRIESFNSQDNDVVNQFNVDRKKLIHHESDHE